MRDLFALITIALGTILLGFIAIGIEDEKNRLKDGIESEKDFKLDNKTYECIRVYEE